MTFGDERIPRRIWNKIAVDADGHWIWNGAFASVPQTRWKVDGKHKTVSVRRLLYEAAFGASSATAFGGCHVRCVCPDHVIATTPSALSATIHETRRASRTTCRAGHVLAEVGTYEYRSHRKIYRHCRKCHHDNVAKLARKRRARRLRRMSPEKRELSLRRAAQTRKMWETGVLRRKDGSLAILDRTAK